MSTLQGVLSPSLSGSSTSVQSSSSVHSMSKSLLAKLSYRVRTSLGHWISGLSLPTSLDLFQEQREALRNYFIQHAIGRNSSLGCSHSDAEKVISTLAQHSPDLRERIILRKLASRMVELQGKGQPACQSTEALRSIQAEWLQRPSSPFDTTEVMTPIWILMVQSRPEAYSPIQSLCVKHTPLKRIERLFLRKSLLGCLSHFRHLPIPLPQDRTGFLLSTMSYLGSSLGIETKSDVYPQSELIETYSYSHP